jgi:transcriptional regulator with XRE-family HTH domain
MTAAAFRVQLEAMGWTQRGFAALLGVAHNTVHRWALDQAAIPEDVAAWLKSVAEFMRRHPPPARSGGAGRGRGVRRH